MNVSSAHPHRISYLSVIVVIVALFIVVPRVGNRNEGSPLADPDSLAALMQNRELPMPPDEASATFLGRTIPALRLAYIEEPSNVLGVATGEKRIEVDLDTQRVIAFEGDQKKYEFVVSTGKWGRTPTGTFTIWSKVRSQKMSGGSGSTYYYLPNVPYVMFFANDTVAKSRGFSFHGAYWHNNFGTPMSHGCINMRTVDAKVLYEWASPVVTNERAWSTTTSIDNPGTKVVVYGNTPE